MFRLSMSPVSSVAALGAVLLLLGGCYAIGRPRATVATTITEFATDGAPGKDIAKDTRCILADGPTMCGILVKAQTGDPTFTVRKIEAWAYIHYEGRGRNDRTPDYYKMQANSDQMLLDFDGDVLGGFCKTGARAQIRRPDGDTFWTEWEIRRFRFLGENPSPTAVRERLGEPWMAIAAYHQSGLEMFVGNGEPLYRGGFGITQVTDPSAEEIWNWKRNVDAGVRQYREISSLAGEYPSRLRRQGIHVQDFTRAQREAETFQAVSGGHYWIPGPGRGGWVKNPDTDGFGDRCLATQAALADGRTPPGWH